MKNALTWIKSNMVTVLSAVLILTSIGVIVWAISFGGAAAEKASGEVSKMVRTLDGYTNVSVPFPPEDVDAPPEDITGVTITKATLKHLDKVYGGMNREYDKTYGPFVKINSDGHYLLVPGVLPTTEASHLRHETRTAYRDAFEQMFEPYDENLPNAPRLNAMGPLNPDELQFELQRVEEASETLGSSVPLVVVEDQMVLQREASPSADETWEWPFRLQVPIGLIPSTATDHTSVVWSVRGIVVRNGGPDLNVEQVVQVYTGQ